MKTTKAKTKKKWTDADFEKMIWHDNYIHGFYVDAENTQLIFDIDYIFEWLESDNKFNFLVSPSTLIFHNVYNLKIAISWTDSALEMAIDKIIRDNKQLTPNKKFTKYEWTINIIWPKPGGNITFESTGFTQIIRKKPKLFSKQKILPKKRNKL